MKFKSTLLTAVLFSLLSGMAYAQDTGTATLVFESFDRTINHEATWNVRRFEKLEIVKVSPKNTASWARAAEFCRKNFGGHGGWRLPNRAEAEQAGILDYVDNFWINEPQIEYFSYPGRPINYVNKNYQDSWKNQTFVICVADAKGKNTPTAKVPETENKSVRKVGPDPEKIAIFAEFKKNVEREEPQPEMAGSYSHYYLRELVKGIKGGWNPDAKVEQKDIDRAKYLLAKLEKSELLQIEVYSGRIKDLQQIYEAQSVEKKQANSFTSVPSLLVLQRVYTKKYSAEQVEKDRKDDAAITKRKSDEATKLAVAKEQELERGKAKEAAARATCMKVENRDLCSCVRFSPAGTYPVCSK